MKKLNLLLAGSLLLMGANVQAQELIWSEDFEQGLGFFTDSIPAGYIDGLDYYIGRTAGNGTWDVNTHKNGFLHVDTMIALYHSIAPVNTPGQRIDEVSVVEADAAHAKTLEKLGGEGGSYYLRYVSGPSSYGFNQWGGKPGVTNDYQANVFVRGIPIEENTSYRVVYFMNMGSPVDSAQLDLRLMRGWYNSEKAFTTSGASGATEFTQQVTMGDSTFKNGQWDRYTYMTYYTTDSIANHAVHQNGYWWVDEWKGVLWSRRNQFSEDTIRMFAEYNGGALPDTLPVDSATNARWGWIVQPDTYMLRFSFQGPNGTYLVDDISLYKSFIGAAEYSGDMIRVDFGYKTNLGDLCDPNGVGAAAVPADCIEVTVADGDGRSTLDVLDAEYHSDGYLYLWLEDEVEYYDDIRINFKNPSDPAFQLKYTSSSRYPKANDADWVDAGKIVPDFQNEFVLPRAFSAVSIPYLAPSVKDSDPDEGSFGLDGAKNREIIVTFNKPVANEAVAFISGEGCEDVQLTNAGYVDEEKKVIKFEFTNKVPTNLNGDYVILVDRLKAKSEQSDKAATGAEQGPSFKINISYGEPDVTVPGSAKTNYDKLVKSYNAADEQIVKGESDLANYGGTAFEAFQALVAQYEPTAFLKNNTSPKAYTAASKALDDATTEIKARFANVDALKSILDKSDVLLADYADKFGSYSEYADLYAKVADAKAVSVPSTSNADIQALVDGLTASYDDADAVIQTVLVTTDQINKLYDLAKSLDASLGVKYADAVTAAVSDDQDLAQILKLEATKALYTQIVAGSTDTVDVTGFITNPTLYTTALLDKDVQYYYYNWGDPHDKWRVIYTTDDGTNSIFPGWNLVNKSGNLHVANGPWGGGNGDQGYYAKAEGFAVAGHLAADWSTDFRLTQTVEDLPAGIYSLGVNYGGGENNKAKQCLIADNFVKADSVAADPGQYQAPISVDSVVIGSSMKITAVHTGGNFWSRLDNFSLKFTGKLDNYNYVMAIAGLEEEITKVAPLESDQSVKFYDMNGIEIPAPEKGRISIRVSNGVATKVFE
ncbi:MAG: hypothetical protein J5732_05030 [Bacteroidaceae bacterium]|nr:hypothetical protein [Bacteroidaceae bacterium]